jgi:hypothetical protein
MQDCPLCGRSNRVVVKGLFVCGDKAETHPDMGYSFCNCRAIFYTRPENILSPVSYNPDENGMITLPDPFFAWPDPYQFLHWDVRKYQIIWDMESLVEELRLAGDEIISYHRDFDVHSKTPQHFHIKVRTQRLEIPGVSLCQALLDERDEAGDKG